MIGSAKAPGCVVKGCSKNVILVKSPAPMFSEALFILKDDAFHEHNADSKAILRQAKAAAGQYTAALQQRKALPFLPMLLSSLLGGLIAFSLTLIF